MNLLKNALLVISTLAILAEQSTVTQDALYNNLTNKTKEQGEYPRKLRGKTVTFQNEDIAEGDSLISDPFEGMTNEEIAEDIKNSLEEYILSNGFLQRLNKFHTLQEIINMKHEEIGDFFQDIDIRLIIPMSQNGALAQGKLTEDFESGYIHYHIEGKNYLVACHKPVNEDNDNNSEYNKLIKETSLMKKFLKTLQEAYDRGEDIHTARHEKKIEDPSSLLGYMYNMYLGRSGKIADYTNQQYIHNLTSIVNTFNDWIPNGVSSILQKNKKGGIALGSLVTPLTDSLQTVAWNNRLANLNDTRLNPIDEASPSDILIRYTGAMIEGEDNRQLIEHIGNYLTNKGIEVKANEQLKYIAINIYALRYFISELGCCAIGEPLHKGILWDFIEKYKNLSEGIGKKSIEDIMTYFKTLGIQLHTDKIDDAVIGFIDSVVA